MSCRLFPRRHALQSRSNRCRLGPPWPRDKVRAARCGCDTMAGSAGAAGGGGRTWGRPCPPKSIQTALLRAPHGTKAVESASRRSLKRCVGAGIETATGLPKASTAALTPTPCSARSKATRLWWNAGLLSDETHKDRRLGSIALPGQHARAGHCRADFIPFAQPIARAKAPVRTDRRNTASRGPPCHPGTP